MSQSKKSNKKSQASMEMVIAIGIVLIIFIFMLFFVYEIQNTKFTAEKRAGAENLCFRVSGIISGMYLAGSGSASNITLDHDIFFESGSSMIVMTENENISCNSHVGFTNTTHDTFVLHKGKISVSNILGSIMINQV
ncbi:hypothetical protein ACFL96_17060 [Thermoproteota archaeon]